MKNNLEIIEEHLCHAAFNHAVEPKQSCSPEEASINLSPSFQYALTEWTFPSGDIRSFQTGEDIVRTFIGRAGIEFGKTTADWDDLRSRKFGSVLYEKNNLPTWLFVCLYGPGERQLRDTLSKVMSLFEFTAPFGILPLVSLHVLFPNGAEVDLESRVLDHVNEITEENAFLSRMGIFTPVVQSGMCKVPDDGKSRRNWITNDVLKHYQTVSVLWDIRHRLSARSPAERGAE
ncbi:hypothetical protein [Emcibacter sp.]|uniref:hypothetical protein n=1 Tax=Emcibacter sp. TaxID=1979954 RepID=UPI002AA649C2|nr:hypothetical protein [Emcibacter sp.]